MPDFTKGEQPCGAYRPQDDFYGTNIHECFAPFDGGPCCTETHGGLVSFCENCNRDHHGGGYETCARRAARGGNDR